MACVLVKPLTRQQLELAFFKVIQLGFLVSRQVFTLFTEHANLNVNHVDLHLEVINGLLVAAHHDVCVLQVSRRSQIPIETLGDIRVLVLPAAWKRRGDSFGLRIVVQL